MKISHLFLTVSFIASFFTLKAQNDNSAKAANNPVLKEKAEKAKNSMKPHEASTNKPSQGIATNSVYQIDENDPYQGRTQEFLSQMTVSQLPDDFPKYNKSYGVSGYNTVVDNFYATHKDILIESVRKKMESAGK